MSLTNWQMEGKESSTTMLPSSTPSVLMVRCPEQSVEVEIGPEQKQASQAETTGPYVGAHRWGRGGSTFLFFCMSERASAFLCMCAKSSECHSLS